jgi:hypothetical protein
VKVFPAGDSIEALNSMQIDEQNAPSPVHLLEHVAAATSSDETAEALRNGPMGALVIAKIAVEILFIG